MDGRALSESLARGIIFLCVICALGGALLATALWWVVPFIAHHVSLNIH